jgi:superfamily I DNA/RNA helicase/PHP family Zn ribbon phosphoesterase
MRITADLHIHSHYSRATSPRLTPSYLDRWARVKGIDLAGTGDCTHPQWLTELRENLDDAEEGFYTLKEKARAEFDAGPAMAEGIPKPGTGSLPRFVLTGEICTIYKKGDKTRKVHHLVILPDFRAAAAFQTALERVGNIASDGRPILGIDSRDLLSILLETDERSILIPAHIWTPWFSALGANSGFGSIAECYGDLCPFIPAIETGLSSNPPMNWAISSLDRFSIISNSDAHSPDKLGREATVFEMDLSYPSLKAALRDSQNAPPPGGIQAEAALGGARNSAGPETGILSTIEFFPQEGKYHYDGHRKCGMFLSPEETAAIAKKTGGVFNGLCPICGKPLTRGVMGRVLELADRPVNEAELCLPVYNGTNKRFYHSLIPLREILGELLGTGSASKKVDAAYGHLIEKAESEFSILMNMSAGEIEKLKNPAVSGELLAEAISRMRLGEVSISPGYDGEYGVIRVFPAGEIPADKNDGLLFDDILVQKPVEKKRNRKPAANAATESATDTVVPAAELAADAFPATATVSDTAANAVPKIRNPTNFVPDPDQEKALSCEGRRTIIIAGPGTGKTALLANRIGRLIKGGAAPASILALSFTVKAAAELRDRITGMDVAAQNNITVTASGKSLSVPVTATFHSLCCSILREQKSVTGIPADFSIISETERDNILQGLCARGIDGGAAENTGGKKVRPRSLGKYIEERKRFFLLPGEAAPRLAPPSIPLVPLAVEMGLGKIDPVMETFYGQYRNRLRESGVLDFDDLIAGTVRLLASHDEILKAYRERFRFIFVDEYQDINFAQYALIRLLALPSIPFAPQLQSAEPPLSGTEAVDSPALWVIGDPNQAIYGFRGSDKRFIDRFGQDYPDARRFELTRSFRCAAPIINAAGQLTGTSLRGEERPVDLFRAEYPTEKSEAEGIARRIAALIGGTSFFAIDSDAAGNGAGGTDGGGTAAPEDCAILLRAEALVEPVIKALEDHGIPFDLTGEEPWWEEEPAKSLIDSLREKQQSSPGAIDTSGVLSPAAEINKVWELLIRNGTVSQSKKNEMPEPVKRLIGLAAMFEDVPAFIDALSYSGAEGLPEINKSGVRVMTIHASKGLEFDHVFIAGLEEGILPFTLYDDSFSDSRIEEERRILYVAMTRARKGLNLSLARSRNFRGRNLTGGPSRFIGELEKMIPLLQNNLPVKNDPQIKLF